jgi:translation initiation factor 1
MAFDKKNIVYSTDVDYLKKLQANESDSSANLPVPASARTAQIRRETKGRGGKTVTVIANLGGDSKTWQKELQKLCSAGGSIKEGSIEIQGDHRDKISAFLQAKGMKVKFTGG